MSRHAVTHGHLGMVPGVRVRDAAEAGEQAYCRSPEQTLLSMAVLLGNLWLAV